MAKPLLQPLRLLRRSSCISRSPSRSMVTDCMISLMLMRPVFVLCVHFLLFLGVEGKKNQLTYLFITNADGSQKLCPLIIRKAEKPHAFNKKTGAHLSFNYKSNVKAWMTSAIYQKWLLDWDRTLRNVDRKILLLQNNFSGHTNIYVVNFKPVIYHTSSLWNQLQPLYI